MSCLLQPYKAMLRLVPSMSILAVSYSWFGHPFRQRVGFPFHVVYMFLGCMHLYGKQQLCQVLDVLYHAFPFRLPVVSCSDWTKSDMT
jgi:hypothetical protein